MFRKFKDVPRITDIVRVFGGGPTPGFRGMRMPDGAPVPVEHIMRTHGVDRERAAEIQARQTR